MKLRERKALLFVTAILPFAIGGGFFTGIYAFDTLTAEMQTAILSQIGSYELLIFIGTVQSAIYALAAGFVGYILAEKTGLLKGFCFEKDKLLRAALITVICGAVFSLDYWSFGKLLPEVAAVYENKITVSNFMASVLYGGVVEEILMRLFLMSLFALLIWKLFFRNSKKDKIPQIVFAAANILAAVLFAAGHLPATVGIFGELSPMIVFRCFLMNGAFGAVFGEMYCRYGIQYAMFSHAGCHIISKLIWIILI